VISSFNPINDEIVDFLMSKNGETAEYDFKYLINLKKNSDFVKIVEDIFAMSNYGGGYILFGFKERDDVAGYEPLGLPEGFSVDRADVQRKFNSFSNEPLELHYKEFTRIIETETIDELRRFSILYVPPSPVELYPIKDGTYVDERGKTKTLFRDKDILIRRGDITDRATPTERTWIKNRVKNQSFQIGILSGDADEINENIYSNIFEVTHIPKNIYECCLYDRNRLYEFRNIARLNNVAFISQGDFVYSFENLNVTYFDDYFYKTTHITHKTSDFFDNKDNEILFKWLLNSEIGLYLLNKNFRYDKKYKNTYFFLKLSNSNERKVSWQSRYRKATRFVVRYSFEPKLEQYVYRHDASEFRFVDIGEKYYLVVKPRIILSYDGFNSTHDSRQGPIITRLLHDEYNDKYLNNVLFWISQFEQEKDDIMLNNRIKISSIPVILDFNKGIRYDRPKKEFKDRIEEMYLVSD